MVIAAQVKSFMRGIVDTVVPDLLADAIEKERILPGPHPCTVMVDVVVLGEIVCGNECFSVATFEPYAAQGEIVEITASHTVSGAAINCNSLVTEIAECTSREKHVGALFHHRTGIPPLLECEARDDEIRRALECH